TIGPAADIYVANFAGGPFAVSHSTDAGQSFAHPNPATGALCPFGFNTNIGPGPALANSNFRTQNSRAIAADPTRPGYVYVAEAVEIDDPFGNTLDEGDVIFARSTDYGV